MHSVELEFIFVVIIFFFAAMFILFFFSPAFVIVVFCLIADTVREWIPSVIFKSL